MGSLRPLSLAPADRESRSLTWDWMREVARPMSLRLLGLTLVMVLPMTRPRRVITAVEWALSSIFNPTWRRRLKGSFSEGMSGAMKGPEAPGRRLAILVPGSAPTMISPRRGPLSPQRSENFREGESAFL